MPLAQSMSLIAWDTPLFWAVFIGWILTVVLHEFAHGVVAYRGGDYTIKERGGLTLNPLQYIDPFGSLVLPAVFLLMGGVPLPGGATYVRDDLLRSKHWSALVALAGPGMNLLIFFACALPLHPAFGWVDFGAPEEWTQAQVFCGAMAVLQILAALFNLAPVPPLDGFRALAPYMKEDQRVRLSTPPLSTVLFIGYFIIVWRVPALRAWMLDTMDRILVLIGFEPYHTVAFRMAFNLALFGET